MTGSIALAWLRGLVARRTARLLGAASGVATAVALVAAIGSFASSAEGRMTALASSRVGIDWQVQVQPGSDPARVLAAVRATAGARTPGLVSFGATTGLQATTGTSTQLTGTGTVVGLPAGYASAFPAEVRPLGAASTGVLVAQQTAANLHVVPGDTVLIGRAGLSPAAVRVDGVVALPDADLLFHSVGAPAGSGPVAPPDNVVLLPEATWHATFDALATARPDLVRTQVHVKLSHALPPDPVQASVAVQGAARNLESRLAGAGVVGDNLGVALDAARSDAIYGQALFLFLGLPGAVLAGALTAAVTRSGAERRRREQALLRARGARHGQLLALAMVEAAGVGMAGSVAGLGAASVIGRVTFGGPGFGPSVSAGVAWAAGAALAGAAIAAATVLLPAWRDARRLPVSGALRQSARPTRPTWAPAGLALVLLAAAGGVLWLAAQEGYQLVLAPEGVPQVGVNWWALAGPGFLWAGSCLLAWYLAGVLIRRASLTAGLLRPFAGAVAGTVGASLARQWRLPARGLALVALAVAFATSTSVFDSTFQQQVRADGLLTNGADVRVSEPPGSAVPPAAAAELRRVPGVLRAEPLQHRFAYVGTDLQDLYGVRPDTIVLAAGLQDAYFAGGARDAIAQLARQRDGVLVSAETVRDFQLQANDRLTLRLQDASTGQYRAVSFRYVGVVKEFPTAPRDSFLVANAAYVAGMTGSVAVSSFLVSTDGTGSRTVADRLAARLGPAVQVSDLAGSVRTAGSSLTATDLEGLTRVELGFALVLAVAASGLVLALGWIERRRTFAIAAALGARPGQLASFVWADAAIVTVGGVASGAAIGWGLAIMLVAVLSGVFDPPPSELAVPWAYLAAVAGLIVLSVAAAGSMALWRMRRSVVTALRDL
jgi:putative ABC transport system permease protein